MINWWITNHPNVYFWGLERGLDFLLVPALFCNKSRIIKDDALSFMKDGSSSVLFSVVSLHSLTLSLMVGPPQIMITIIIGVICGPSGTCNQHDGFSKKETKNHKTTTKRSLLGNDNSKNTRYISFSPTSKFATRVHGQFFARNTLTLRSD